ncbi:MAG: trypsin-like peptidase domain-containing protein [Syntrophobacteraceae bacterium]|jgi:putative serine protease PepD
MYLNFSFGAKGLWAAISILLVFILGVYSSASALTAEEVLTIKAYEKVAPSVVNLTTQVCEAEFFYCATPSITGSGSGVVLREDGLIITNSHVVSGAQTIRVVLSDGRRLEARITASDPDDDLAVIKVDVGDKPLRAIALGDSDSLRVGQRVLAVGNPFGLGQTLTSGVISMTDRTIRDNETVLKNLIQTDAPINPGNSGGALINLDGELVGLCTAILSPTGSSIRIGFALPVKRIKAAAPELMHPWHKITGWVVVILLAAWFLRRIYRNPSRHYDMG